MTEHPPGWSEADARHRRATAAACVLVILLAGMLVHPMGAQSASRYALTGAMWDDHSLSIDGYYVGVDRAVADGRTFSDKALGQPLFAVPVYAAYRAMGGEPARVERVDENLGLWLVTLWSAVLPAAVLVAMMAAVSRAVSHRWAARAAVTAWAGTVLLPLTAVLFGHVLAATCLFAAFVLLMRAERMHHSLLAGALAGAAVVTEYTTALGVVVLVIWLAASHRRRLAWFVTGGLGPAVVLGIYNLLAFGSPWTLSYQFNAFHDVASTARPLLHMFTMPTADNVSQLFLGPRGFLLATPVVLLGVWGLMTLIRRPQHRALGWVALAMFGVFLLIPVFWQNPWGGDSPGPRYMAPAMAFLAPGIAAAWERRRILTSGTAVVSILTMGLATLTNPIAIPPGAPGGLAIWLAFGLHGRWAPTLPGLAVGRTAGLVLYSTVVAVAVIFLVRATLPSRVAGAGPSLVDQELT
ncbi:hypothetical protein BH23ACT5_BH23ACT5_10550 [soil metagenome]